MQLASELQTYIRTTNTCQLDCDHCYSGGRVLDKKFFDPSVTVDFFHRLKKHSPHIEFCDFAFHGGEPMLAPIEDMRYFMKHTKSLFNKTSFSIQTNLTYKMTPERLGFLRSLHESGGTIGTSWDANIRFETEAQKNLWRHNSELLIAEGIPLGITISVTKDLVDRYEPIELIDYAIEIGFSHILFERLTISGKAIDNPGLRPSNKEMDRWFLLMWEQSVLNKTYKSIHNLFLEPTAKAALGTFENGQRRCRGCEQRIISIDASGTVGGCADGALEDSFGNIRDEVSSILNSKERNKLLACEAMVPIECYKCPVHSICKGDCHRQGWEDGVCAAPKSLMMSLQQDPSACSLFLPN